MSAEFQIESILFKKGELNPSWKQRYFVLKNNELRYYARKEESSNEANAKGVVPLTRCTVEFVPEEKYSRRFCFELYAPEANRTYILAAETGTLAQEWMNVIRRTMLKIRREKSRALQEPVGPSADASAASFSPPPPSAAAASAPASSSSLPPVPSYVPANSTPAHPENTEDKYRVYLNWLEENKSQRKLYVSSNNGNYNRLLEDEGTGEETKQGSCCCRRCIIS
eukprot:TRINITY_DN9337_c0_g2_i3.p1 TRINITY_DN9337_c0_g2~~TRINITY_DN9337_c0_g2_i3.p1  ORF type:complete len:225 (-),score=44.32 TRINITY_DN9337_c0_g2_i3:86-760(-)